MICFRFVALTLLLSAPKPSMDFLKKMLISLLLLLPVVVFRRSGFGWGFGWEARFLTSSIFIQELPDSINQKNTEIVDFPFFPTAPFDAFYTVL